MRERPNAPAEIRTPVDNSVPKIHNALWITPAPHLAAAIMRAPAPPPPHPPRVVAPAARGRARRAWSRPPRVVAPAAAASPRPPGAGRCGVSIKDFAVDQGQTAVNRRSKHDRLPLIDAKVLDRRGGEGAGRGAGRAAGRAQGAGRGGEGAGHAVSERRGAPAPAAAARRSRTLSSIKGEWPWIGDQSTTVCP
ncbi:hypothetical protein Prum_045660 [Phytohabitans rumicis]|uniref:Uncharacterized protein n=1 Tax=Phytohabitans rumicis TaxID=1076125 RepID=A0A6V8L400_9ACTN|nr:hypothetical protein Prum_045660 [Phytohabitans rumicis]